MSDEDTGADVYLYDASSGGLTRVGKGGANGLSLSADARYVAFAGGWLPEDIRQVDHIWVWDRTSGMTERVSVSSTGQHGDELSMYPSISSDGSHVVFVSWATNLVAGDNKEKGDIFIRDRSTGTTELVTVGYNGEPAIYPTGGTPFQQDVSGNGRYVAFSSTATNLVPGDTNGQEDLFVRDMTNDTTTRISTSLLGEPGNGPSNFPNITADGRYVAFNSKASNLVPGDTNGKTDVFLRDLITGSLRRVSLSSSDSQVTGDSSMLHGGYTSWDFYDGETFRFYSNAPDLVSGDTNGTADIFVKGNPPLPTPPVVPLEQTFGVCSGWFGHAFNPTLCQSDPVNSATGSFTYSETDLALPGIGLPFSLERFYNSADSSVGSLGRGWTYNYGVSLSFDMAGNARFRSEDGQQISYTKNPDGSFAASPGGLSKLNAVGLDFELTRRDGVRYLFNSSGKITQISDRNGNALVFAYIGGLPSSITDTAGRLISLTHNAQGLLEGVSLPDGRHVGYAYTGGLLTSVTNVRGGLTTYSYDSGERLREIVDPNGHSQILNNYGPDGRVISQTDPLGHVSTFAWNPGTQTSTMTDAKGKEWKDVYRDNVLLRRIDPLGNQTAYVYDENLNLVRVTDPNGKTTTMEYDAAGNLTKRTAPTPLSYQESFTYDAQNNLLTSTDGRGNITSFEYDIQGNLTRETKPGAAITEFGRDPAGTGLLTSRTDPRGKITQFEYDSAGNLTKVTSPLGNVTTQGHDASGRLTSRVEPRGNVVGANPTDYTWLYTFDEADNIRSQIDPLGNVTEWSYDPVGNLISVKDARNHVTSYGYNDADELASVTAPDSTVTTYEYDEAGRLIRRTDAKNHVTSYGYDDAGRLISTLSPIGQQWTYGYDPIGNVTTVVTARGNSTPTLGDGTITRAYDVLNRLTTVNYADSTPDVAFTYDANGNRTQMVDGSGTETYNYDALDRLTAVTRGADTFSYGYDSAGNVTRRTYPDGTVVDYTYDNDGQLATVVAGAAATSYGYDPAGNLLTTTLPGSNGYVESRIYDKAGRLTEVKNAKGASTLSRFTYTLNAVGNPTQVVSPSATATYTYDEVDRLTEVCFQAACPGGSDPYIRWAYDAVGNRTAETRPSGTRTYTYNDADQLLSTAGAGATNYSYDADGNQTTAGSRTFNYDLANRLSSTTGDSTTISYTYDGEGKRLLASSGTHASKKTKYLWDPNHSLHQLALERDGSNALRRRYVHGADLISMFTGSANYYFHHDNLGSVANLTSSTGVAQWTHTYEPFGTLRAETKHNTKAPTNPMRFTGEMFDADTGLYHLRARQFDSASGRFLATDPLAPELFDPYVASYVYANNRPTSLVDPSGLRAEQACLSPGYTDVNVSWLFLTGGRLTDACGNNYLYFGGGPGAGAILGGSVSGSVSSGRISCDSVSVQVFGEGGGGSIGVGKREDNYSGFTEGGFGTPSAGVYYIHVFGCD